MVGERARQRGGISEPERVSTVRAAMSCARRNADDGSLRVKKGCEGRSRGLESFRRRRCDVGTLWREGELTRSRSGRVGSLTG